MSARVAAAGSATVEPGAAGASSKVARSWTETSVSAEASRDVPPSMIGTSSTVDPDRPAATSNAGAPATLTVTSAFAAWTDSRTRPELWPTARGPSVNAAPVPADSGWARRRNRYMNAAMASRFTACTGRKVPSSQPVETPAEASQEISPLNWVPSGTSLNVLAVPLVCGGLPASRNMKAAMASRFTACSGR
ncbi:hypothetical protein D9M72_499820 [compost metagenome]